MAYCPKCSREIGTMDIVCKHCGYDFPGSDASEATKPEPHQTKSRDNLNKKRKESASGNIIWGGYRYLLRIAGAVDWNHYTSV